MSLDKDTTFYFRFLNTMPILFIRIAYSRQSKYQIIALLLHLLNLLLQNNNSTIVKINFFVTDKEVLKYKVLTDNKKRQLIEDFYKI